MHMYVAVDKRLLALNKVFIFIFFVHRIGKKSIVKEERMRALVVGEQKKERESSDLTP